MRSGVYPAILILLLFAASGPGCLGNTGANKNPVYEPVPLAVELHGKGLDAYVNGNFSEALDLYNRSILVDPNYTVAWMDKGNALMRLNRSAEAIAAYDEVLGLESDLAIVWNNRGEAFMALGNYSAAIKSFDQAIRLEPDFTKAKENRDLAITRENENPNV